MKKTVYIILFILLGVELQFLIHAFTEMWYINLLLRDFPTYGLGFTWRQWFIIHHIASTILLIAGAALGFWQGNYWWRRIYGGSQKELTA